MLQNCSDLRQVSNACYVSAFGREIHGGNTTVLCILLGGKKTLALEYHLDAKNKVLEL